MGLIVFLLLGFGIGLVARAVVPGAQRMSVVQTTLLGIAGSFVGGFLTSLIMGRSVTDFHTAGILGSVLGAGTILYVIGSRSVAQ